MRHDERATRRTSRRRLLATTGALAAGGLAGCLGGDEASGSEAADGDAADGDDGDGSADESTWRTTELTTVRGEESFSLDGLEPPVVVQSFAVWCPKCGRQSEELAALADSTTVVGLNTDPNEDAERVRRHAEQNGFDWRFAVAPAEMTDSLVEAFGPTVVNAPSTPLVVVCEDDATFDAGDVRSAEAVRALVDGC